MELKQYIELLKEKRAEYWKELCEREDKYPNLNNEQHKGIVAGLDYAIKQAKNISSNPSVSKSFSPTLNKEQASARIQWVDKFVLMEEIDLTDTKGLLHAGFNEGAHWMKHKIVGENVF